jgi:hypothetical protein
MWKFSCTKIAPALLAIPFLFNAARGEDARSTLLHDNGWTGSLLAPSPAVIAQGVLGVEPYVLDKRGAGSFDNNGILHSLPKGSDQLRSFTSLQYGVTESFSVQIVPSFAHVLEDGGASGLADLPVRVKYRWTKGGDTLWFPAVTTTLGINFPVGRYQRLNQTADGFGNGAYTASAQLLLQSLFLTGTHANRMRLWATLNAPLGSVTLHGISSYGTDAHFTGWAVPGRAGELGLADEFALDRHWVLALDAVEDISKATHLHDAIRPIVDRTGESFSVAPAVEYNFSRQVGVIVGAQFTLMGRNSSSAVIPQVAVNMFF